MYQITFPMDLQHFPKFGHFQPLVVNTLYYLEKWRAKQKGLHPPREPSSPLGANFTPGAKLKTCLSLASMNSYIH
jgi:hypothetical protein